MINKIDSLSTENRKEISAVIKSEIIKIASISAAVEKSGEVFVFRDRINFGINSKTLHFISNFGSVYAINGIYYRNSFWSSLIGFDYCHEDSSSEEREAEQLIYNDIFMIKDFLNNNNIILIDKFEHSNFISSFRDEVFMDKISEQLHSKELILNSDLLNILIKKEIRKIRDKQNIYLDFDNYRLEGKLKLQHGYTEVFARKK